MWTALRPEEVQMHPPFASGIVVDPQRRVGSGWQGRNGGKGQQADQAQGPSHCSKLLSHRGLILIPTMNGCTSRQLVLFTYHRADRRFEQEIGTKGHDTTGHPKS
jgi:hypothetical protein